MDRTFISGIGTDAGARELALAIVRLVDTLGLPTVAEGMETAEELAYVRALGVDFAQGYLLSRPLPAAAIAELLDGEGFDLDLLTATVPTVLVVNSVADGAPIGLTQGQGHPPDHVQPKTAAHA